MPDKASKHLHSPPLLETDISNDRLNPTGEDPEAFQLAVSSWAERLLAAGVPAIEPPRNIAEVKVLNDIIRKARGMDVKATSAPQSLVSAPRTLSRRPAVVVDAEESDPFVVE